MFVFAQSEWALKGCFSFFVLLLLRETCILTRENLTLDMNIKHLRAVNDAQ